MRRLTLFTALLMLTGCEIGRTQDHVLGSSNPLAGTSDAGVECDPQATPPLLCEAGRECRPATAGGPRLCAVRAADGSFYALEGEQCGGYQAGGGAVCEPGLVCQFPPNVADVPGVCRKSSGLGAPCSATVTCQTGMVCRPGASGSVCAVPAPDGGTYSVEGESCGGYTAGPPPACTPGLACVLRMDVADVPGVCRYPAPGSCATDADCPTGKHCGDSALVCWTPPYCGQCY